MPDEAGVWEFYLAPEEGDWPQKPIEVPIDAELSEALHKSRWAAWAGVISHVEREVGEAPS